MTKENQNIEISEETNSLLKKDTTKAYVLRLKNSLYDELDQVAEKRGHSVNTLMILALNDWLEQQSKEEI
jgi:predicted HicB family RNase H-like nuclease